MSEPIYDATTEKVYGALPGHFHRSDERIDYPLKRYLSGILKQQNEVDTLIDRFTYTPPEDGGASDSTSDLVDPFKANSEWLPWLAQLVGMSSQYITNVSRQQIANASSGFNAGTKASIAEAAKTVLVGDRYVKIFDHSTDLNIGGATSWDLLIVTKASETLKNILDSSTAMMTPGAIGAYGLGTGNAVYNYDSSLDTYMGRVTNIPIKAGEEETATGVAVYTSSDQGLGQFAPTDIINFGIYVGSDQDIVFSPQVLWYTSGGSLITASSLDDPMELDASDTVNQVHFSFEAPATAAKFKVTLNFGFTDVGNPPDHVWVSQMYARLESDTVWIPESADPVKAVIQLGAKPAGHILYHKTFEATWNAVETAFPTWNDWEEDAQTWTGIEEAGLDDD